MRKLTFGTGAIRIEMDDALERLARRALDDVAPGVLDVIESRVDSILADAKADWPVRTGLSRDALEGHTTISPDGTSVRGSITDDAPYAYMIRAKNLGGKSPVVELVRKPMQAAGAEVAQQIGEAAAKALGGAK